MIHRETRPQLLQQRRGIKTWEGIERRAFLKTGFLALVASACKTHSTVSSLPVDEITSQPAEPVTSKAGDSYCIYQVTKITGGAAACPFKLLDTVCVNCPPEGNCLNHASVGARRWILWADQAKTRQICDGEWVINNRIVVVNNKVVQADCAGCPDGGKKGYQFI